MRIAVCLSQFYPTIGGAERQLLQLATAWVARGHRTIVFTRHVPGLPERETHAGVEIYRVIRPLQLGPLFGLTFITSLGSALVRHRDEYDVVLAGQLPWEAVATGRVAPVLGKPCVARVASIGERGDVAQIAQARGSALLRRWLRRNARFVVHHEAAARELVTLGCRRDAIDIITNGVDLAAFAPPAETEQRERIVLAVARLAADKRVENTLRAWKLVEQHCGFRLVVIGTGPQRERLETLVRAEQIPDVEFLGLVEHMHPQYARAELLVVSSAGEGCSNALLEAMAAAVSPIVTNIPGNVAVVEDRVNGRIVAVDDPESLARVVQELLTDPAQRRELGKRARERVELHHRFDVTAERYLQLFGTLVEQPSQCAAFAE